GGRRRRLERHLDVGLHPTAFEPAPVGCREIAHRIEQDIAVEQLLRRCRQRLTRRPSSEHARTTERLQPGGKALRRARRKLVDENGHRAGIRPYRPSVARRPPRIKIKYKSRMRSRK